VDDSGLCILVGGWWHWQGRAVVVVAAVARPVLVWLLSFVVIAVAVVVTVLLSMWLMVLIAFEDKRSSADA
jgi:hypothetical protein